MLTWLVQRTLAAGANSCCSTYQACGSCQAPRALRASWAPRTSLLFIPVLLRGTDRKGQAACLRPAVTRGKLGSGWGAGSCVWRAAWWTALTEGRGWGRTPRRHGEAAGTGTWCFGGLVLTAGGGPGGGTLGTE